MRLRNLLVHRYWVIDDKRIYEEVRKNFGKIIELINRVKGLYGV